MAFEAKTTRQGLPETSTIRQEPEHDAGRESAGKQVDRHQGRSSGLEGILVAVEGDGIDLEQRTLDLGHIDVFHTRGREATGEKIESYLACRTTARLVVVMGVRPCSV